ncbi:MAG: HlyD family secretion protein [Bacteriovoracaceae bacterium]|nr:HlyD family secretion protein [Bacteriovoracaceae bacterium]
MKKQKKIMLSLLLFFSAISAYFIIQHMLYETTDNAQIDGHFFMLAPKVSGFIKKVHVKEGQKVKEGDVLVEIDARDFQYSLDQMQGEMVSKQATLEDAKKNAQRMISLFASGAVSQQQRDAARSLMLESQASYESLSARVSQAKLNLENTFIKAPMDGFIAKKSVEEGQLASVGTPLFGFVGSKQRWVVANLKETQIESIHPGSKAEVSIDAYSGKTYFGVVESISAATGSLFSLLPPDNATGNFTKVVQRIPVHILLQNLNESDIEILKLGLSAEVKIRKN